MAGLKPDLQMIVPLSLRELDMWLASAFGQREPLALQLAFSFCRSLSLIEQLEARNQASSYCFVFVSVQYPHRLARFFRW